MDIYKKIEEIRQKPEHIRLRYVWGAVFVSMIFIIFIWMLSFSSFSANNASENQNTEIFDDLEEKKKSLSEFKGEFEGGVEDIKKGLDELKNNNISE